jgi:hypothetical protein
MEVLYQLSYPGRFRLLKRRVCDGNLACLVIAGSMLKVAS